MQSGRHPTDPSGADVELSADEQKLTGIPDDLPRQSGDAAQADLRARRNVLRVAIVAALGGLLYGYDTGVIAGAMLQVSDDFDLTGRFGDSAHNITEVITASILLGAVIGALATSALVGRLGRRRTIIVVAVIFAAGVLLSAVSGDWWALSLSRIFLGLAVGGATQAIPTYIAELAPSAKRGSYVTMFNIAIGVGILSASMVNFFVPPSFTWHWRIAIAVVPAIILILAMLPLPESPRWLVSKDHINPARRVLRWARPSSREADTEVLEIQQLHEREIAAGGGEKNEWRILVREKWMRPAIFAGVMVAIFTQITGLEMMIYYTPTILKNNVGFSDHLAQGGNVGVGIVYLIMTIVGKLVVDKVGRRGLALWMLPGAAVSIAGFGLAFWFTDGNPPAWLALTLILLFMFFQAGGIQVIGWLVGSEIYPLQIRSVATSMHAAALWGSNLLITITALSLIHVLTLPGAMLFYAALNVIAWLVIYFRVPETAGRSLEEIEDSLKNGTFLPFERQHAKEQEKLAEAGEAR